METFPETEDGIDERLLLYRSCNYTHYFYSPSDDRYCNAWGWKFLYNDSDRNNLKALKEKCVRQGLEFVWTIRPGNDYAWDLKDYDSLLNKLVMMYYSGFRSFAVCLPETGGDFCGVRDSLEADFVRKRLEDASVMMINDTPTVSFPSEGDAARTLIRGYHLDAEFCTSVLDADAVVCILKEQTELSKIAVATVSDCAADPRKHDSDRGLSKGIDMLSPDARQPLITFLEHTGGGAESESTEVFELSEWTREKADKLYEEFVRIGNVPAEMAACSTPELQTSLAPWLRQFDRLGRLGRRTLECLEHYKRGDLGAFWVTYIDIKMSDEDKMSDEHHRVGEKKLYPFCAGILHELSEAFASEFTDGEIRSDSSCVDHSPVFDSDFTTSVSSSGHIVFQLPGNINTCRLLTGRLPAGEKIIFRQLGAEGELLAEFVLKSSYSEFDIKTGTVQVDVIGDVEIYESIFLSL